MAYSETEILALAKEAFAKYKAANPQAMLKDKKRKEVLPEYYPGYKMACDYAEHIRDHAVVGRFPEKLFAERSPNQTEKEQKYIRNTYKQVTLPVHVDYLSTVTRGDNPNNVSIKYEKEDTAYEGEKSLQTYLETGIKDYGSLEVWRKSVLPSIKSIDANGIICIKPYYIPTVTETEDAQEKTFIDPDKLLDPIPYYYCCEKIVSFSSDEYYLVEMEEKSMVNVGGTKDEPFGKIYEFIDEENIYRVEQYGKYNEGLFNIYLYFNHAEGVVPVTVLGGIPVIHYGMVIWQSPFLYATDLLDLVVLNHSNMQVSINSCVYPYAVAIGSVCNFDYHDRSGQINKCNDGWVYDSSLAKDILCPSCEGAGLKDRRSPLGVLLLRPGTGDGRNPGEETFKNKPLEFISPEVHTLEFLAGKITKDEMKARQILHLGTSETDVKGSPDMTATKSFLDSQAMEAFSLSVLSQQFDITRFVIDRIGWQRYGEAYKKPSMPTPSSAEFLTAEDYAVKVSEAVKAQLPPFMIRSIILKYLQAVFYGQKESIAVFEIVTHADRILTMDSQDIAIGLSKGTIAKWEVILHDSSVALIQELILDGVEGKEEPYLELPLGEKIDLLIAKAKEKEVSIPSLSTGQPSTSDILNTLVQ